MVISLRYLEYRLYLGRILYRRCSVPNTRQPGAPGHDGSSLQPAYRYFPRTKGEPMLRFKCGRKVSRRLCYEFMDHWLTMTKILQAIEARLPKIGHQEGLGQIRPSPEAVGAHHPGKQCIYEELCGSVEEDIRVRPQEAHNSGGSLAA